MTHAPRAGAISRYRQVRNEGSVEHADPHRLIAMLLDGALSRIAIAAAQIGRNEIAAKGASISQAIAIVGALRASLDLSVAGGLPQRLDALYDYVGRRLFAANLDNDPAILEESAGLIRVIADGWNRIAPAATLSGAA